MATDEALAIGIIGHAGATYLRFYQWNPPTLSFGYNQKIADLIDIEKTTASGIGIVKRMSGGKMVFHADELTFSAGISLENLTSFCGKNSTYLERFQFMCEPIISALKANGVPARFAAAREIGRHSVNRIHCYATAAGHSIFAEDKKIVGAAGIIKSGCFLIHGSIPISIQHPPDSIFKKQMQLNEELEIACLSDYSNQPDINVLSELVAKCYSKHLELRLEYSSLTSTEHELTQSLMRQKYQHLDWKIS